MTVETNQHTNILDNNETFSEAERNAMRAFLQRCEVRMSTMHRIVTAFISGAGLLLLFPVFLRDIVDGTLLIVLNSLENQFSQYGDTTGWLITAVLYGLLLYPFMLSLMIPLYGVSLLLKDLVHFYFTLYMPGFPERLLNPALALYGVAFSHDESPRVKRAVLNFQYAHLDHFHLLLPMREVRLAHWFDEVTENTNREVMPKGRAPDELAQNGVQVENELAAQRLSTAFGLARTLDRTLVEEVAITEMLMARNNIYLRRLLLRYVKTLLIFIWTTVVTFLMLPLLEYENSPTLIILGIGYLAWSVGAMPVIRVPLHWVYDHRQENQTFDHVDRQLTLLDSRVRPAIYSAIVSAILGLMLAIFQFVS